MIKITHAPEWRRLVDVTSGLQEAALIKNFFDMPPIKENEILEIFNRISTMHNGRLMTTLRAYSSGRSEEHEYKILTSPPRPAESLVSWYKTIFKEDSSAIILNRAERWSVQIADFAAQTVSEITNHRPTPDLNVETVLFIGNYGFSPFGIHKDYDSIKSIHIPLLDTKKSMYLWSEDDYEKLTGCRRNCYDPPSLIHTGIRYEYALGDLFFLPPNCYHVGYSPNFSVSLAIVLSSSDISDTRDFTPALNAYYGKGWSGNPVALNLPLVKIIELTENFHKRRKLSNLNLAGTIDYLDDSTLIEPNKEFSIVSPFKIDYVARDDLVLYARGKTIRFEGVPNSLYIKELALLFDALNARFSVSIESASTIIRSVSIDAIVYIFELLVRCHIIR
ncbi:hypothetical protein [Pseudomonas sp. P8_241]|uniref:hypothetical protein n=1 Tax=Pseudomonas sp. P8_241 TaxID=3043445 RepID=UPI002A366DD0|nr:hypothetical protein [Pseudomonas sp. P8_241]WPN47860.1 hypothetical protein QMK58_04080 [Pseudomonas sp. P8_241]